VDVDDLRVFVRVAELSSFTRAAEHLGVSKAKASLRVRALEEALGTALLQRSTRAVRLTPDGEQLLARARKLVAEADEIGSMFRSKTALRGRVRIDLPVNFARDVFFPNVPELLARHPELELVVSATDRRVDVVREGFDCVLSIGQLGDSGLAVRRIGLLPMTNLASRGYLERYGTPRTLADLERHVVVHYSLKLGGDPPCFEHPSAGGWALLPMRSLITVNSADSYWAACVAGLGIIQIPRYGMPKKLSDGAMVEILPEQTAEPMPISIVHPHGKSPPKRVRAVMTWLGELAKELLEPG
jgi:DNA-binding transcriptional LysR family regulator